jgi:sugar lactone lactonase YvrE
MWNDHCVKVFSPSGKEIQKLTLAAKCVTCTGWAGKNLDRLVVTTAQPFVGRLPEGDHGGHLFLQKVANKGMVNYEFGRQTRPARHVVVTSSL